MNNAREVVVTGIGVVSPIGVGTDDFWDALINGRSGVSVREAFADSPLPIRLAAPVTNFDARQHVKPRKAMKIMCEPIQFGCGAANMAFEQAGLPLTPDRDLDPDRIGTVFGTETFFADPNEVAKVFRSCTVDKDYDHDRWGEFAMRQIQPLWMLKYLPNMAASHISIALDARGPSNSICQGEVSGLLALIEAASLIGRGAADVMICGGTGSQMALNAMVYRGMDSLSNRVDDPEGACRPFEKSRDGLIAGEGAGVIVLESREHAARRNADVKAVLKGWSRSYHDPQSVQRHDAISHSIQSALDASAMTAEQIGLYCANAGGQVEEDRQEAEAVASVLSDVPVTAHKSNFGNLGPGTSIVELIGGLLSIEHQKIPPTLNYEVPDPACNVNVSSSARELKKPTVLKTGFAATGQAATVVFSRES